MTLIFAIIFTALPGVEYIDARMMEETYRHQRWRWDRGWVVVSPGERPTDIVGYRKHR